jgi:hypothetical protein
MTYLPPGVPVIPRDDIRIIGPRLAPGTHTVTLVDFYQAPASKTNAYYTAYVATYRGADGAECDEWIRFVGKKSDYYSGLRVEMLCSLFDAPVPAPGEDLDPAGMLALAEGISFQVRIERNGEYLNVRDVFPLQAVTPATSAATLNPDIPF